MSWGLRKNRAALPSLSLCTALRPHSQALSATMRVIFLFALFFALLALVSAGKHKAVADGEAGEAVVKTKSYKKKCGKKAAVMEAGEAARRLLGKKKYAAAEADGEAVVMTKSHKKKCGKKAAVMEAGEA